MLGVQPRGPQRPWPGHNALSVMHVGQKSPLSSPDMQENNARSHDLGRPSKTTLSYQGLRVLSSAGQKAGLAPALTPDMVGRAASTLTARVLYQKQDTSSIPDT